MTDEPSMDGRGAAAGPHSSTQAPPAPPPEVPPEGPEISPALEARTDASPQARRWPAVAALVTAVVLPRTTTLRTRAASWWGTLVTHAVGLLMTAVCSVLASNIGTKRPVARTLEDLTDLPSDAMQWAVFFMAIITIEAGAIVLATAVAPWGARDEKWSVSWSRSLRRVWLFTPALAWLLLVAAPMMQAAEDLPFMWDDLVQFTLAAGTTLYGCFVLLRMVSTADDTPMAARSPMCEGCGYDLTMTPWDGTCPECGRAVRDSLGEHVRPGVPWSDRSMPAWFRAPRTLVWAMWPGRLPASMRLRDQGSEDYRTFAPLAVALVVAASLAGMLVFMAVMTLVEPRGAPDADEALLFAVGCGGVTAMAYLGVLVAAASVAGALATFASGRNMLRAAVQAAVYRAAWPAACVAIWWGYFTAVALMMDHWPSASRAARHMGVNLEFVFMAVWLALLTGTLLGYVAIVTTAARGARFANR